MRHARAAFTLIELLVVVSIIGILVGLIFTLAPGMIKKGNEVKSLNNMRQVANGFMLYTTDNDGRLPNRPTDGDGSDRWPYLINEYLKDPRVFAAPDDHSNYLRTNLDPVSNTTNNTSYIMNGGLDPGVDESKAADKPLILAGIAQPSKTILLGCIFNDGNFFLDVAHGDENLIVPDQFGTSNIYVFMDGSAQSIKKKDYVELNQQDGKKAWLWLIDKKAK